MARVSKYMKLNPNVLMEWIWDSEHYISENYKVITNLSENKKRSFLSTSNNNNYKNNLFQLDPVLKKFSLLDTARYNFLQEQDYNTSPIPYDVVRIYIPTSYDFLFNGYVGLYLKIFTYSFYNDKVFEFSNIFFDATLTSSSGLTNLAIPFIYDEQEWGKYYEFEIPSIDFVSNQRSGSTYGAIKNSLNFNLTNGEGLSLNSPIFVDFHYLNSKDSPTNLSPVYYYASESYRMSFPKAPEYNTLAVKIEESTEGDFFEIYGTYGDSNENLDNFIESIKNKGRNVRIEYDVYLYEENIQTNMQTFVVTGGVNDDFTKKILYRPVLTFSNTTAAIKVSMRVIDLVDMSTIERSATLGLNDNIQKYGKRLISLNVQNLNKLKIYNAKPDEIVLGKDYFSGNMFSEIIKVYSPQLIEVGNILVNSPASSGGYKGMGLLNIVITPFDNIIQFRLAQINGTFANQLEQYDLSNILNNSEMVLSFKSDTETIDKSIYNEADNDFKNGTVNFKLVENDLNVLKNIYNKGYNNFYLTILSRELKTKTLLYSGTYSFYENMEFLDNNMDIMQLGNTVIQSPGSTTTDTTTVVTPDWPKPGRTVIIYTKYKDNIL